jgi:hypothetical protein
MVFCSCQDCLNAFYAEGAEAYTDEHGLDHHPRCNHITEKEKSKIEFEDEVYYGDGIWEIEMVVHWEGYSCTCECEYKKDEEE